MSGKQLVGLLLVGLLLFPGASCAPVGPPGVNDKRPVTDSDPENPIPISPPIPPEARTHGLRERIEMAIDQVRKRPLETTYGFWTVFHAILGLGPSTTLVDPVTGARINALDYICDGGELRGLRFIPTPDGLDVQTGPQFVGQGHQDQFLAELAQWGMPADRKFIVGSKQYTFMDFINNSKARARITGDQELSWTILILGQYLGTDLTWKNSEGEQLRLEDLLRYELEAPIEPAACGGTHRLFDLCWVYHLHLGKGGKKEGVWQDIANKMVEYQRIARAMQNPDGSFSTNFFQERGNASDMQLRLNTSGHILEWLALSLSDAELNEPWVQDAVNALTLMFFDIQNSSMEGGTLYHAAHGLLIYYARVFGPEKLGDQKPVLPYPLAKR